MRKEIYRVLIYLTYAWILFLIKCQTESQTPCQKASSTAKSYNDCKSFDNTTAETVCCFVQGTSNNTAESACLDVDILFAGKTIAYSSIGVTGQLICQAVANAANMHFLKTMLLTLIIIIIY